jgi:Family of unknown function (DUF5335)
VATTQSKAVPRERWVEFLSLFSNGNRGRRVSIETISSAEDWRVASQAPLLAIDYDPAGKGDDVVISLGQDSLAASHVVQDPQELWEAQDENGKVVAVQIVDKTGAKTLLGFE